MLRCLTCLSNTCSVWTFCLQLEQNMCCFNILSSAWTAHVVFEHSVFSLNSTCVVSTFSLQLEQHMCCFNILSSAWTSHVVFEHSVFSLNSTCSVWKFCLQLRGELSYLAPSGSENISAPYFKQCFFQGVLPPDSQTPRLPVPRQK